MKRSSLYLLFAGVVGVTTAIAGGRMDLIEFPDNYRNDYSRYLTANRANNKPQMVDIYANNTALQSAAEGASLAHGSILVMEVYKAAKDAEGNPIKQDNGVYQRGQMAAIAVMEKRDWGVEYPADDRAGDWGFAFYDANGQPKTNELDCAACHEPHADQDYLFTLPQLSEYAGTHQM